MYTSLSRPDALGGSFSMGLISCGCWGSSQTNSVLHGTDGYVFRQLSSSLLCSLCPSKPNMTGVISTFFSGRSPERDVRERDGVDHRPFRTPQGKDRSGEMLPRRLHTFQPPPRPRLLPLPRRHRQPLRQGATLRPGSLSISLSVFVGQSSCFGYRLKIFTVDVAVFFL